MNIKDGDEGRHQSVRFEVLTAMLLKIQVFWDVPRCRWSYASKVCGAFIFKAEPQSNKK
jgi:hypothetical protein